jgi:hypothetical protein
MLFWPCYILEDIMIKKSQLIQMFESMRAQAPWDVDSDLLWGFFFTGDDKRQAICAIG